MSGSKKAKAKVEQAKGAAKKAVGRTVGNEKMTAEGKIEQSKGDIREAKEKANDAFKR